MNSRKVTNKDEVVKMLDMFSEMDDDIEQLKANSRMTKSSFDFFEGSVYHIHDKTIKMLQKASEKKTKHKSKEKKGGRLSNIVGAMRKGLVAATCMGDERSETFTESSDALSIKVATTQSVCHRSLEEDKETGFLRKGCVDSSVITTEETGAVYLSNDHSKLRSAINFTNLAIGDTSSKELGTLIKEETSSVNQNPSFEDLIAKPCRNICMTLFTPEELNEMLKLSKIVNVENQVLKISEQTFFGPKATKTQNPDVADEAFADAISLKDLNLFISEELDEPCSPSEAHKAKAQS